MAYCTKCGSELEAGVLFCTHCGAPVETEAQPSAPDVPAEPAMPASPQPASATPWQDTPAVVPQQVAAGTKSGCMPTVLVVLGMLALLAALGIGGLVYAGYKMKQKATAFLRKTIPDATTPGASPDASPGTNKPGSPSANPRDDAARIIDGLTNILGAGGDEGDPVESINDKTPVEPCPSVALPSQSAARIPLQAETVITTAWGMKNGDVESRDSIESITPTSFVGESKTGEYKDDDGRDWKSSSYADTVCNADLASADTYVTVTFLHMPHLIHGVTRLRLSSQSFDEAKNLGKTTLRYFDITSNGNDVKPNYEQGILTRVEPQDVPYPMIVNDQRVTLPVIHLAGIMDIVGKDPRPRKDRPFHTAADFYVIDDPLDPLVLMMKLKDPVLHEGKFRIEVVKIEFKTPNPVNIVEKQLTEQKRAITYGIYFDFNKDSIKPESEPVLKQIVQAMMDNPGWKLTVNGHTDNMGGDAYNLDLSKRRAAAVKQALVSRYHIAPDRLSTDGFGASSPVDTNDTLEGRARNRRVELTRE
ncbi:MAG TPA: OmpA family protein [Terracidiphilus sp.]|jgi:outer membrane protein OmpA-like peptidoglycan-associated protein|nr:OmpA family protein [Terracidiphilus sp.]